MKGNVFLTKDGLMFLEARTRNRNKKYVNLQNGDMQEYAIRPRSWKQLQPNSTFVVPSDLFFSNGWMCWMDLTQSGFGILYLSLHDAKVLAGVPQRYEYSKFVPFLFFSIDKNGKLQPPAPIRTGYGATGGYVYRFNGKEIEQNPF